MFGKLLKGKISSLAASDALTKLLIDKGRITEAEFMQKLFREKGRLVGRAGKGKNTRD